MQKKTRIKTRLIWQLFLLALCSLFVWYNIFHKIDYFMILMTSLLFVTLYVSPLKSVAVINETCVFGCINIVSGCLGFEPVLKFAFNFEMLENILFHL